MAVPNTKATLKEYCLRALGEPVVDVNVDDDQIDDRLDEALQYFAQYHYDGIERMYLKHEVTSAEITRADTNTTTSATDTADNSITADWLEGKAFIPIPSSVVSVVNIFPFTDKANLKMFDVRYQMRLNDLFDFSSTSMINYQMTMQHLDYLDHILVGEKPIRYSQHQNRLYIDMDWGNDISAGEYIIIECFRKLNPLTWPDIYDDIFLKRYSTALIKKQWGQNLSKFNGVAMLGGVQLNGEGIYTQALEEITKLEEEIRLSYEMPMDYMIG
tara:strand:- start:1986 stop:2801 length:816 start_codon:yes stop_codon:yes gene_type:complete